MPTSSRARRNKQFRDWRRRNPKYFLRQAAERRAKKKGIEFSLTIDDIPDIPETCPVALIPIFMRGDGKQGPCDNSPTLDRVSPAKGYVPDNIRVISFRANRWKADMEIEDLERVLSYMRGKL